MRILHCCLANFYIDGFGYQENVLTKKHKEMGYDVKIIASTETFINKTKLGYIQPSTYVTESGISITRIPYSKLLPRFIMKKLRMYRGLSKLVEDYKPDIIFVHDCQFLDIKCIVNYAKKNSNVRIYVDSHTDFINSARGWVSKNILHKIVYKYCAQMIEPYTIKFYGVLPIRADFYRIMYNIPKEKLGLLVMGADDENIDFEHKDEIRCKIRKELNISKDDFVIITGGKIDQYKNIHLLMRGIHKINKNNIKLIVFGSIDKDMKEIIENLSNSPTIRYIGWIESSKVYDYFISADIAVFPGTHSVLWEQAVGSGLPCVFKKWEGIQHIDLGGNCEFLHKDSSEEIMNTILNIYNDKEKYNKMKKIAVEKGIPYFSYSEISRRAIEI